MQVGSPYSVHALVDGGNLVICKLDLLSLQYSMHSLPELPMNYNLVLTGLYTHFGHLDLNLSAGIRSLAPRFTVSF